MDKSYQKERIKLALMYFAILFFIVALFSSLVISIQNSQFNRFDKVKYYINKSDSPPPAKSIAYEQLAEVDAVINEIKSENLKNILLLDALLLFMASFLAYYLSGRTLEPILDTLNKQKRFVSDASHELKTPLTTIRTEAEVLNRSKNSSLEEYKEFTANTIQDIDKLNELVIYLLDAARFEDGKIEINKSEVNIKKVVEDVLKKFELRIKEKSLQLSVYNDQLKNPKVQSDKVLLEKLITIFIDNAIKYNKENGELKITLEREKATKKVLLKIKDTGVGIHPDDLPRIFDRFYRASEDRNEKGFGLGLSIAQSLARELDIDVEVDSTMGEGTEFVLTF